MSNWRDLIIDKCTNQNSSFYIINDPDYLLDEELVLSYFVENGYFILRYEDSIKFRYIYEQKIREAENSIKLIVITNRDISLPYEFETKALKISMDVQSIFPKFSSTVIRQMNREDFDGLYKIHNSFQGNPTEQETLAYIIRSYYKIPYEMIDGKVELYKTLLSLHYQNKDIPEVIGRFLYEKWKDVPAFKSLQLKEIIRSTNAFYQHLEEEWKEYIVAITNLEKWQVQDLMANDYSHPLANGDVRRMMSDLFLEGILEKVKGVDVSYLPDWMKLGVETEESKEEIKKRSEFLATEILNELPKMTRHQDWLNMMNLLTEYKSTALRLDQKDDDIMRQVNKAFQSWMVDYYQSLTSLPPYPNPKLVHHIPHVINNHKRSNEKTALLVLDGMSYFQWKFVKDHLKDKGMSFDEQGVFAWVPTLTSLSRQAIFSGEMPLTFNKSITTTSVEERLWKTFWERAGILKQYVTYQRGLGVETYDREKISGLVRKRTKVFGAVIDVIDQFSHHAVLGEKSVYSQLEMWLSSNYLETLLKDLHDEGYTVYITSDHGNTKATGIGRISEGLLVDQKGERVRIYRDSTIYHDSAKELPTMKWSNIGLPDDYYVLLAHYGEAFVHKEQNIVTHGGISIEEVIVPFIKVKSVLKKEDTNE